MSERFEIKRWGGSECCRRADDTVWAVYDNIRSLWLINNLTKSQAEKVKKALDEATKPADA